MTSEPAPHIPRVPHRNILSRFSELATDRTTLQYLVADLIPDEGWSLLVGQAGVGKSTFAAQMCDAIQQGTRFLGLATRQHTCLYFQADVSMPIWRDQIRRIAPHSHAWSLHNIPAGALDNSNYVAQVQQVIEYTKPGFIVFDALNSMTNSDINTKNVSVILSLVKALSVVEGVQVPYMVLHHPSKATSAKGVDKASGYHGISASCDTYLSLETHHLQVVKSRVTGTKKLNLKKNSRGLWEYNRGGIQAVSIPGNTTTDLKFPV